jgi:predicted nucleic acid-binding protein
LSIFVDSNVLLYAASGRAADVSKAACARQLLREEDVVISFQVLQEFYANAVNPRKLALTAPQATAYCSAWLGFTVAPIGASTFVRALELVKRYRISNWDAAILAAAIESGCGIVYSEDLSDGQDYGGVRVVNPFRQLQVDNP